MKSSVVISPYSVEWPYIFAQIREELVTVFSQTNTQIEHIGSTAVVGLCAKPVIDILLGTKDLSEIESQRACKKFCVNATEQISDRVFEYDHQIQS